MSEDYYDESDELMWVKAGEPGEKPTIIRQIHSESTSSSSRDNSGSSTYNRKHLLTVENGTVYRTSNSSESINKLGILSRTSSDDSRVIVVNIAEQMPPPCVDKDRIRKWKELHSPRIAKKLQNNNNNNKPNSPKQTSQERPSSQPISRTLNCSPKIERCTSAESAALSRLKPKTNDEGYTSLNEDCKDSDTESIRSKSLPSSWRPMYLDNRHEKNLNKYAQKMMVNHDTNYAPSDEGGCSSSKQNKHYKKDDDKKSCNLRHNIESTIEMCTCFVCLRSVVYHAEDEDDTDSLVDHPCTCSTPSGKCCGRWAVISVMACFLPFLLCYPPLKTCLCIHDARVKKKQRKKEKKLLQDGDCNI